MSSLSIGPLRFWFIIWGWLIYECTKYGVVQSRMLFHPQRPMALGDKMMFNIDRRKPRCRVFSPYFHVIKRFKDVESEDEYEKRRRRRKRANYEEPGQDGTYFYAITGLQFKELPDTPENFYSKNEYENQVGYAWCRHGWIQYIGVNPNARGCGLGTLLSELCMIDPDLNANRHGNLVFQWLRRGGQSDEKQQALEHLQSRCHGGVIGARNVAMSAQGRLQVGMYFSAAMEMGYQYMVVQIYNKDINQCGPNVLFYNVKVAKQIFNANTGNIGDVEGSGYDARWYFCREHVPSVLPLPMKPPTNL